MMSLTTCAPLCLNLQAFTLSITCMTMLSIGLFTVYPLTKEDPKPFMILCVIEVITYVGTSCLPKAWFFPLGLASQTKWDPTAGGASYLEMLHASSAQICHLIADWRTTRFRPLVLVTGAFTLQNACFLTVFPLIMYAMEDYIVVPSSDAQVTYSAFLGLGQLVGLFFTVALGIMIDRCGVFLYTSVVLGIMIASIMGVAAVMCFSSPAWTMGPLLVTMQIIYQGVSMSAVPIFVSIAPSDKTISRDMAFQSLALALAGIIAPMIGGVVELFGDTGIAMNSGRKQYTLQAYYFVFFGLFPFLLILTGLLLFLSRYLRRRNVLGEKNLFLADNSIEVACAHACAHAMPDPCRILSPHPPTGTLEGLGSTRKGNNVFSCKLYVWR